MYSSEGSAVNTVLSSVDKKQSGVQWSGSKVLQRPKLSVVPPRPPPKPKLALAPPRSPKGLTACGPPPRVSASLGGLPSERQTLRKSSESKRSSVSEVRTKPVGLAASPQTNKKTSVKSLLKHRKAATVTLVKCGECVEIDIGSWPCSDTQ